MQIGDVTQIDPEALPSIDVGGVINFGEFKANKANNLDANYFKGHDNHGARTVVQVNEADHQSDRVYSTAGLSRSLLGNSTGGGRSPAIETETRIRRLTPVECERLQGVPDNYTNHVSDTQRYKMLGNGWQIDTIVHILNHI